MANVKDLLVNGSARVIGTIYGNATSANNSDKLDGKHLNEIAAAKSTTLAWGASSTIATIGGNNITVTMPANPNTDTHYTTGITAGVAGTTSNSTTTNGNTFIKIKDNSTHRGQIKIVGSGATSVSSDANGVITINSTDNNTTYGSMSVSEGTTGTATNNRVLTAANLKGIINAHAPTKTGGGASGTWGISISGNAATANAAHRLIDQGTITAISGTSRYTSGLRIGRIYNSGYPFSYGVTLTMEASNFGAELIFNGLGGGGATGSGDMRFRTHSDWDTSEWGQWRSVLDSSNYTSYTVTKTGSGANGTWGISISGNAATATKLATARTISLTGSVTGSGTFDGSGNLSIATTTNHTHSYAGSASAGGSANSAVKLDTTTAGDSNTPVYFSGGKPVACTSLDLSTSGNAATATNADKLDNLHASDFVRAHGTTADNIDADWGQSFKTFDPIPSGTPPEKNPNISLLSIGNQWHRRKMFAFMYNNDNIYYRRRHDNNFTAWVKLLHTGNYTGTLDDRYVKKSGDTMTGKLELNSASYPGVWIWGDGEGGNIRLFTKSSSTKCFEFDGYDGNLRLYYSTDGGNGATGYKAWVWKTDGSFNASKVYGAVWNDYAEYRSSPVKEPGRCVYELGDDTLALTTKRLQKGCEIISDTFGFAIGETEECKTPIAVTGRVLAYPYEDREEFKKHIGDCVCSGPDGTVSIMTPEEEKEYPSCIIGTISAIPSYEKWGSGEVDVSGRVWIRIR